MEILYQDEAFLLVNKPAGLLTIQDGYNPSLPNLLTQARQEFGACWVVHRLDKDTSGLVLIALNAEAHRNLNLQFQERKVSKVYYALTHGKFDGDELHIDAPLKINGDRNHRTTIDYTHGKPAQSRVHVVTSFDSSSLVSVYPQSGYTHQIRAHLAHIGHPLLGDTLYFRKDRGFSPIAPDVISRVALHGFQIEFCHPVTGFPLCFKVEPPYDFQNAITILKKSSGVSSG